MAKDPAFLFYPGDWLGGTMSFSRAHKGAYMDLLMAQFNQGHLPIEDIKTILNGDFESMWESKLKSKFKVDDNGHFYNERLDTEFNKRKMYSESRRKNLQKNTTHMDNHMENRDENENMFLEFWDSYNKKVGKPKSLQAWNRLSDDDRSKAMAYIPKYIAAQPDKKFRLDPERYISRKKWEDEIISSKETPVNPNKSVPGHLSYRAGEEIKR